MDLHKPNNLKPDIPAPRGIFGTAISSRCTTAITGPSGHFRTSAALAMAAHVATGTNDEGRRAATPGSVLFLTTSQSARRLAQQALTVLPSDADQELLASNLAVAACPTTAPTTDANGVEYIPIRRALSRHVETHGRLQLLVIDELADAFSHIRLSFEGDCHRLRRELHHLYRYADAILVVATSLQAADPARGHRAYSEIFDVDLRIVRWRSQFARQSNPTKHDAWVHCHYYRYGDCQFGYAIEVLGGGVIQLHKQSRDDAGFLSVHSVDFTQYRDILNVLIESVEHRHDGVAPKEAMTKFYGVTIDGNPKEITRKQLERIHTDVCERLNVGYDKDQHKTKRNHLAALIAGNLAALRQPDSAAAAGLYEETEDDF